MPKTKFASRANPCPQPMPQTMPAPRAVAEMSPMVSMLERVLRDPSIPMDRLQQAIGMMDAQNREIARRDYMAAMAEAQEAMRPIAKDCANPQTKSRYSSLAAVDRAIRPIYSKHGLFPSFDTAASDKGADWVKVLCTVAHRGGHSHEYSIDMPADGKGAKGGDVMTRTHATGSAVTYGRRYLLAMIFNLATFDDDGNAAGDAISAQEVEQLQAALIDAGADLPRFYKLYKIERIEDFPARKLAEALDLLERKKKAAAP